MRLGYQFTSDQPTEEACRMWFEWFQERRVPAAIVQIKDGFFVFRKGMVFKKLKDGTHRRVPVEETPLRDSKYEILKTCHGYEA